MIRPPSELSKEEELLSQSAIGLEPTEPKPWIITGFSNLFNAQTRNKPTPEPETSDTQESYQTIPELSEATEKFFSTLLNQNKQPETHKDMSTSVKKTSKLLFSHAMRQEMHLRR